MIGTERWLRTNGMKVLPWPANSPDLNPIESVWAVLARKLRGKLFSTYDDCWAAIQAEWSALTPAQCTGLVMSLDRRLHAVKKARGLPTRY